MQRLQTIVSHVTCAAASVCALLHRIAHVQGEPARASAASNQSGLHYSLDGPSRGVLTQEQRQFLLQEHCSTIQGYLIARPKPAAEAFSFVRSMLERPRLRGALAVQI